MREGGGKGDKRRPLVIPEEQFNAQWDAIFGKKEEITKTLRELVDEAPLRKDPKKQFVHPLIKRLLNRIVK